MPFKFQQQLEAMQASLSSFPPHLEQESSTWDSDPIDSWGLHAKPSRPQSFRHRRVKAAALAIAAFFLLAVVYTAFCKKLKRNVSGPGLRHRRLAEGGGEEEASDDELQAILESCVDYEVERDLLSSLVSSTDETDLLEPAAKKARLVALAEETVSSFSASLPTHEEGPSSTSTAAGTEIMPLSSPEPLQTLSPEFLELYLQSPPPEGETFEHILSKDSGVSPSEAALETEAWLQQIPSLAALTDDNDDDDVVIVEESSSPQGSPESDVSDVQPSTSAAASEELKPASPAQGKLSRHRYVRLPKVRPGAIKRTLMVHAAGPGPRFLSRGSSYDMLATMRGLFAKSELDEKDVEELLQTLEKMINFVHKRISPNVGARRYGELVGRLGNYFLILDSVVNACKVLGPAAVVEQWWDEFASCFTTDYEGMETKTLRTTDSTEFNRKAVFKLQEILRILKTGKRPPARDVIEMKRMLFCCERTVFSDPKWKPWRMDDELYKAQQDASDESDDQEEEQE